MRTQTIVIIGMLGLFSGWADAGEEQAFVAAARQVLTQYGDAVVWLGATTKIDVGGGKTQEDRDQCPGIVIGAKGLIVTSLNRIDPTALITASLRQRQPNLNPSVTVSDIKVTWPDGREHPGRIVLKDPDLDLAFIQPQWEPNETCPVKQPILLTGGAEAQIFDRIKAIGRLEDRYNRELVMIERRVAAVINKPRRLYYVQEVTPGAPVFTEQGTLLGLVILQMGAQQGTENLRPMILPAADIAELADQAAAIVEEDD